MGTAKMIRFFAVEKITFIYMAITMLIILCVSSNLVDSYSLIGYRLMITITIIVLSYFNSLKNWWVIKLARYAFIGALLSFWYPDTFDINRVMNNHDNILASSEQFLFGFQPSLLFHEQFSQKWLSEIFNMGYFAYYPIILGSSLYFFFLGKKYFEKFFFVLICSFYFFYLFYILFPTAGPQYYFPAIGIEQVKMGIFPHVGQYFNYHSGLEETANSSGFFFQMVENTQQVGERPTAAFPSSHVGIATLIMIMILRYRRYWMFVVIFPVYLALVFATVYIEAHYVIDVIGGFISAILLYFLSSAVYRLFTRRYKGLSELTAMFHKEPVSFGTSD